MIIVFVSMILMFITTTSNAFEVDLSDMRPIGTGLSQGRLTNEEQTLFEHETPGVRNSLTSTHTHTYTHIYIYTYR